MCVYRCLLLAAMAAPPFSSSVPIFNKSSPVWFPPCLLSKNHVVEAANPWSCCVVVGSGGHGWFDHGPLRCPIFCNQAPLRAHITARQPWNRFASTVPAETGGEDADLLEEEGALSSGSAVARDLRSFWWASSVDLSGLALWAQLARTVPLIGTADPSGKLLMACSAVPALRTVFVVAASVVMASVAMMQEFFGRGASVVQGNRRWLFGMLHDVDCYDVEIQIVVVSSSGEFLEYVMRQLWILMVCLLEHFRGGVQHDICKCFCCISETRQDDDFSEDGVVLPFGLILQRQMREPSSTIPRSDGRTCLQLSSVMLTTNLQLNYSKPLGHYCQESRWLYGWQARLRSLKTPAVGLCQSSQLTCHQTPVVGFLVIGLFVVLLVFILCSKTLLYLLSL